MARGFSNKFWFNLHSWIGVQLGLLLFVILFSGSLATVAHEIDWLLTPAMRVTPRDTTVSYGTMLETVRRAFPEPPVTMVYAPRNTRFAVEFQLWWPDAEDFTDGLRRVYVNPYTGEIQGVTGWLNVQRALRNFHMNLSLPVVGIYVVGSFGFLLLTSVVTALLFYTRWWRRFFVLRARKGWRVFWSDFHRTAGLWSLWFTVIIAATGIWYFVEMGMFDAGVGLGDVPDPVPVLSAEQLAGYGDTPVSLPLDRLIASAKDAYPSLEIASIYFPNDPREAIRFTGHADAWLVRSRANNVYVNPYDATVIAIYRGEDLPPAYRWVHTADPLHFGDFGGLATKLVWCLFGLVSSGLTLTGAYLWFKRNHRLQPNLHPPRSRRRDLAPGASSCAGTGGS